MVLFADEERTQQIGTAYGLRQQNRTWQKQQKSVLTFALSDFYC